MVLVLAVKIAINWLVFLIRHQEMQNIKKRFRKNFIEESKHNIFWDEVPLKYAKDHYKLYVRECSKNDIIEIDTYAEFKEIDASYK